MHTARASSSERTVHGLGADGSIRDWLVGPSWPTPCDDLAEVLSGSGSPWGDDGRWTLTNGPDVAPLKQRLYERHPLVTGQDLPELVAGNEVRWHSPFGGTDRAVLQRWRCEEDGLLDWSAFCYVPEYRHAVAGAVLEVDQAEWRTIEVASTGPVALWVGGTLVGVYPEISYMEPVARPVRVRLASGTTPLVLATWQVAFREVRHIARVRIGGLPVRVVVPSPGADEVASAIAERALESLACESWALRDGVVRLRGPEGLALRVRHDAGETRLRLVGGAASFSLESAEPADDGIRPEASMLSTGESVLRISVDDERCPVERSLRVARLPQHRDQPVVHDPSRWRDELLAYVAATPPTLARALAVFVSAGGAPTDEDLGQALGMVGSRADTADFQCVGLLQLWHRVPEAAWPGTLRQRVRSAVLEYKYWIDQPGLDAMCYFTENHQLVYHVAELLAGEAFPGEVFANSGWLGAEHARHGRGLALEWMRRKLHGGFSEFDSNAYVAIDALALVSLVDHAEEPEVAGMAEALLDKLLFTLGCNSWRGIHGAAHGRSYAQMLHSSRFEETAPIMWALFGRGALNGAVLPAVCLATSLRYVLPEVVRAVADTPAAPWWGRQVYRGSYRLHHDLLERGYASDLRVWKSAHAMLASVQDYRSGLPGLQEHVWGVTLAPEVQVFATNPATSSESPSARPNAWAGERLLPRARQHEDCVVSVYPALASASSPPTHVSFPASFMDEVLQAGPWLAGRVGDGYVAVACDGGLHARQAGQGAGEEWFPNGDGLAYVATVGDAARDGSFPAFVSALGSPEFTVDRGERSVRYVTRHGVELRLAWSGSFLVAGRDLDLSEDGTPATASHLENPACRTSFGDVRLVAELAGHSLVLDLVEGRRLVPASGVPASGVPASGVPAVGGGDDAR